jgi:hypothetical protein
VKPKAQTFCMQHPADRQLRSGVSRADARHEGTALCRHWVFRLSTHPRRKPPSRLSCCQARRAVSSDVSADA